MSTKPLFEGLIFDEFDRPVEVSYVGDEPCYVVDDNGFRRHIPSKQVDIQILQSMKDMIAGNEDLLTDQAAKMLGQDDPFSRASIAQQLKNIEKQFDQILQYGIPEGQRAYMGMMGFKIHIDFHGNVTDIEQPGLIGPEDE